MTNEITQEEFVKWTVGGESDIRYVIVKTQSCPKCERLLTNLDKVFGKQAENVAILIYGKFGVRSNPDIVSLFEEMGIASVPRILVRFLDKKGATKIGQIMPDFDDDFIELTNIFDAINSNDQSFFGFNEYDEKEDSDADDMMNRVLRTIYGELPQEAISDRKALQEECESCRIKVTK
jgi:hypothetical protein